MILFGCQWKDISPQLVPQVGALKKLDLTETDGIKWKGHIWAKPGTSNPARFSTEVYPRLAEGLR